MLPGAQPKPSRALWDQLVQRIPEALQRGAIVVGDDPWSDLAFAQTCGLQSWLVDRHDRFADLTLAQDATRVRSLLDIPVP